MSESTIRALFDVVASNPELQHQFATASDVTELRAAIAAAGFDPDTPDIATAIDSVEELSDTELATTSGGISADIVASNLAAGALAVGSAGAKVGAELRNMTSQWWRAARESRHLNRCSG